MRMLLFLPLLMVLVSATLVQAQYTQPQLKTDLRAIVPTSIENLALYKPEATARIVVGADGRVEDIVVLEASHEALVNRTKELLLDAKFAPALQDGQPVAARISIVVKYVYASEMGLATRSSTDHIEATMNKMKPATSWKFEVSKPNELDKPLKIVESGEAFAPVDESGKRVFGDAVISFYVDEDGQVCLPQVDSTTNPLVVDAAVRTLKGMRFTKPIAKGKATVVQVKMPFSYQPESNS